MKQTIKIIFLILLIPNFIAKAQQTNIQLIARPLPDSILLRWAPTNYNIWTLGNQYGYKLIRYTLVRDSIVLDKPEIEGLNTLPLRPYELYAWESIVKKNKYAAIAAQALYGKTFQIDAGKGFNPQNMYYKSKEQEQRFAFALYAADLSTDVAMASGLYYVDKKAQKNEKYLYRVFIDLPDSLKSLADTAYIFTGIPEYWPLPVPVEFEAQFEDKLARLSWNILAQNNIYISWEIERSSDKGRNYTSISPDAIVPLFEGNEQMQEYSFKFDSLQKNGVEYWYRLRGISSFGERGPWSNPVKGKGIESIPANANITSHLIDKKSVLINWEFPMVNEKDISGFKVLRSNKHNGVFNDLSGKLKPNKREFIDKKPIGTAYYKVMVYLDTIAQKLSYPYLVQLTDSLPPHRPVGLLGIADTSGIVKLSWTPNTDNDIYGYQVFRSASGKDEFTLITELPIPNAFYTDTINKQDLNPSVFYKILALDQRQNQSKLSPALEVIKPDIIAPSIPVITETKLVEGGILLNWINSSSSDVAKHEVYRQSAAELEWIKIAETEIKKGINSSNYTDNDCPTGTVVRYKIMAVDKNANQSQPSFSVDIKAVTSDNALELKKLQKQIHPELGKVSFQWEKPAKEVVQYKIYKKVNEGQYELYETIEGAKSNYSDDKLKIGNSYKYRIKAYYTDESISPFSKELLIKI